MIGRCSKPAMPNCSVQTEEMRSSLLSSVSHDLRTPLAAIVARQREPAQERSKSIRRIAACALQTIADESKRLIRLVENLLDMTRLESGAVALNKEWHVLEEIAGTALNALRDELKRHAVRVDIPADFPLIWVDEVLMGQVIVNLLENACRYTPPGSRIELSARHEASK